MELQIRSSREERSRCDHWDHLDLGWIVLHIIVDTSLLDRGHVQVIASANPGLDVGDWCRDQRGDESDEAGRPLTGHDYVSRRSPKTFS